MLIRAFAEVLETNLGSSEEYRTMTVNTGRLNDGVAMNVIPELARADFPIRIAIGPEDGASDVAGG